MIVSTGSVVERRRRNNNVIESRLYQLTSDFERPATFLDSRDDDEEEDRINVVFLEDDDDYDEKANSVTKKGQSLKNQRWSKLKSTFQQRLEEKRAKRDKNKIGGEVTSKQKDSSKDKKRRMMMFMKEKQREKKLASRIERPMGFEERVPLAAYIPGMELTGIVISLTNFGAYVDVGTECDGLLHISQMSRDVFVEHPRQLLSPGDEVTVKVRSTSPELKKMHLTMLDVSQEDNLADQGNDSDRIPLTDIEIDDELWGELKRVTDFGAYIEVGAEVDGFLHFMDHPLWDDNMHPSEFMKAGQRVRVWVADVDTEKRRIRLTANRPASLPGPRFEF
ncbi:30S ribosomal protein S1 [Nitzschia inconspicua]|uniref:30S ribosomal protein S1 n=1 Tax=Nitzschia inconspicua TaxID=303405 RepID=A0A9K3Q3B4_9STRA|nr:30S ribosomal protein S1 [Nitzschia inconspicua]